MILLEPSIGDTEANPSKELIHDVMIMDLEQTPCQHFSGLKEMVYVSSVMIPACIAGTLFSQRCKVSCVGRAPHVEAEWRWL